MALKDHIKEEDFKKVHLYRSKQEANKGCVVKCTGTTWSKASTSHHGCYRRNGYEEISGKQDKLAVYNRPERPGWAFVKGKNFKGLWKPYKNNAHHILPATSLSEALSYKEAKLLMKAGYNLNAGINMIFLPCNEKIANELGLYPHPGGHATYNEKVAGLIAEARQVTEEEKHEINENNKDKFRKMFENWEEAMWKTLTTTAGLGSFKQINDLAKADNTTVDIPKMAL